MKKIIAKNVTKIFGMTDKNLTALENFNIEVNEGEFVCIVGPSGCGKSTFLRILNGLYTKTEGEICINRDLEDKSRPVTSMVFQESALFPWKNVFDNVVFGLKMRNVKKKQREEVARHFIEKVGLTKFMKCYPYELSGGMKQRVNIARAFANDPEILLMDEPFGSLDAQTRVILQEELLRIWEEEKKTVVFVTHSIDESILLGDKIFVMTAHPGKNKATFTVDIKRPRTLEVKKTTEFSILEFSIWEMIKEEVIKTM